MNWWRSLLTNPAMSNHNSMNSSTNSGSAGRDAAIPLSITRIQATIDYIEDHLSDEFGIKDLAQVADMSQWHFQRVFRATVGETVKNYIRSRRLSRAATALLASNMNILEIALEAGFDSNEAFTRAFRAQFATTPREFRQQKQASGFPQMKLQICQTYLEHLHANVGLEPRIELTPSLRLVGVKADITVPHEAFDLQQLARPIWQAFSGRLSEIERRSDDYACLLCDIVSSSERHIRMFVLPCVEVKDFSDVPEGMITAVRPQLHNAIFSHAGSGVAWEYTMHYIFGAWLPESGHQLANAPTFCRFDPEHSPFDDSTRLDYYVALR
jgi:AraC family transcriptional regulator